MALFVDGPACTIDDLVAYDSGMLSVAEGEGIDVSMKIQLATEEMMSELQLWIDRPRPAAGQMSLGLAQLSIGLEQIAVTLALKRWQILETLTVFYRDAYFSQLVDRYQKKWDEYERLTRQAREMFVSSGVAIVRDPVRRAKPPVLGSVAASQASGTYYAAVSYLNSSGQEGAASEVASIVLADGQAMTVMAGAAWWNVYAGTSLNNLLLQNERPLGSSDTWTYAAGAAVPPGLPPCKGQMPDYTRQLVRTVLRG